ncbi:glycosyltransferase family 2 protein [Patescibacteria group bacterium]|nr:glycosyltransferase family 2 protein [Patescibacteria group bacterium]
MSVRAPKLSIVVPLYNEAESMPLFFERIREAAPSFGSFELVMVDDGSNDGTVDAILREKGTMPVSLIRFGRNFGQTAALAAGIERARGDVIVTIDSDLENDPRDIPKLVEKLDEGFTVVSGWRQGRWKNEFFARRLPSVMANELISFFTGVYLHDYGCTLKAYKAEVVQDIRLYGDMHRFVAAFAAWRGGLIAEVPVSFEPRRFGRSKYGFGRIVRVLLDLVFVAFMRRYFNHPMRFFGGWGFVSIIAGFVTLCVAFGVKFAGGPTLIETPLPNLAALFVIVGVQFVLFGVLAEIIVRTYYESQNKRPFSIAQIYEEEV